MNVAFFSYKGGVGRSLILLGTAVSYAAKYGVKIGIVDADIEAPSLHYLLDIEPERDSNFTDILLTGTTSRTLIKERDIQLRTKLSKDKSSKLGEGEVYLFPSLADKPAEKKVPRIVIDEATQDTCEDFLNNFSLAEGLNHIFIDCRTGFSRLAAMVLNLADLVVLACRIDRQNLQGVKMMINRTHKRRKNLLVVANMVPKTTLGTQKLMEFQKEIGGCIDVSIAFDERLIFGDIIAPLDYGSSDPINVLYGEIARKIKEEEFNEP